MAEMIVSGAAGPVFPAGFDKPAPPPVVEQPAKPAERHKIAATNATLLVMDYTRLRPAHLNQ
jgi:hypothetical protein